MSKITDITKPILELQQVEIGFLYRGQYKAVVMDCNLQVFPGETLGLVGESGSGKTTIGRAIIRINPCRKGKIIFEGKRISGKLPHHELQFVHENIQMIFQDPAASLNERATVDYIVSEGIDNYHLYASMEDRRKKIIDSILNVGLLPEHLSRYPHEFSGGQRQRIGIARALIMNPKFIVADEPISALDVSIRAQVLNLLKDYQKETNMGMLFIAHDLSVVKHIADRIAVIYQGRIVELADSLELFDHPLHPYTKSLLASIPLPDPELESSHKNIIYDPSKHDYQVDKPKFVEIVKNHFVYANKQELAEYKNKF
ncbi:MAG TPA: peptide ABC transporter ATP-binding protein [Firmicutes bacterium]|jgi:oligopeptide transport system ATP-binding protein|nr:peptide ABC transporter ATP-binding protein [Bacillota bacterium]